MSCLFCDIASGKIAAHVVADDADTAAFLDKNPLFFGHVLVVPKRHVVTLDELEPPLLAAVFGSVQRVMRAVVAATGAEGTFIANNNKVSQSVLHLHVHVVPRTKGDGLKGFFWPRKKYPSDEAMAEVATSIRARLDSGY
jgi:histidine triad (HIT) family protein